MGRASERQGRRILPCIWQLNTNTFIVRVQPIDPSTGKRRNVRRVLLGVTRREAIERREQLLLGTIEVESTRASSSPTATPTISTHPATLESFARSWLSRKIARGDVCRATQARYAVALDRLSPRLREMPVAQVQPEDIENWMVKARETYAPTTINGWLVQLRTIFNDARRPCALMFNPAEEVAFLKVPVDLEQPNALEPNELVKLLSHLDALDPIVAAAAWTQALTGLRWGEVSALKFEDLNEGERVIHVRRCVSDGELVPRTKTGRARYVGVSTRLLTVIRAARDHLDETEHPGRESGLMFPSLAGTPLASARISELIRDARTKAGIKQRFTSHGLRRSMTDLLRRAKVDPVIAKAIVGHATDRMREHYSTLGMDETRDAADRVAAVVDKAIAASDRYLAGTAPRPVRSP